MPDLAGFAEFHFLRPLWLLGVAAALVLWLVLSRKLDPRRQWRRVIAPHLLVHLQVAGGDGWRVRPLHMIVAAIALGSVGVAGPTWEREVSPFAEDESPLVIAIDLSRTMNAVDVQPTRLERAKQKVRDLLALRAGARTALIVYAGSVHTVLPPCDDGSIFETFLEALATDVMPVAGKDPSAALAMAEQLLAREETAGSILFLTDGIGQDHLEAFTNHASASDDEVLVLAVGTEDGGPIRSDDGGATGEVATLDVAGLAALSDAGAAFVTGVTADDADVARLQRRVQSHLALVQLEDTTARWKDQGYWLVPPLVLLALLWFRKGWTVRWNALAFVALLNGCSGSGSFVDLWLTADQQGRYHFDRGDFGVAAERFEDPFWKGVARYRAGDDDGAVTWLATVNTPEASYDLGNALSRLGRFEEAASAYEAALEGRLEWLAAEENLTRVRERIEADAQQAKEEEEAGDPSLDADEIVFDEQGKKGKAGQVDAAELTDDQLAEMWMRRLQTRPADFLRQRFAIESAEREKAK